jgi:acyl-CoA thioester hydrolase
VLKARGFKPIFLMIQPFITHLRVRHYEMDAQGHVNNAVYQHYLEQAAIEHCEAIGFAPSRYRELGGTFVMRRVTIDYLRPAVAGDTLAITTWLQDMRGTRSTRRYEIRKAGELTGRCRSALGLGGWDNNAPESDST